MIRWLRVKWLFCWICRIDVHRWARSLKISLLYLACTSKIVLRDRFRGLIWNLSEWMTTIVYKGTEWKLIHENGTDLSTYFPVVEKTGAGDEKISKTSALGTKLVALLQRLKPSALCCLNLPLNLKTIEGCLPDRSCGTGLCDLFAAIAPLRAHSIIWSTKSRCTTSVTYSKDWSMCLIK